MDNRVRISECKKEDKVYVYEFQIEGTDEMIRVESDTPMMLAAEVANGQDV